MSTSNVPTSDTYLLTIRGTYNAPTSEAARQLHNETAGLPASVAGSRALGDLSHKVYLPAAGASGAEPGELLIMDVWTSPGGIQAFFADPHVQAGGAARFSSRDPVVWMPAAGAFTFHLPAPIGRNERYVGVLRARVRTPGDAIAAFRNVNQNGLADARRLGQISCELFFRLGDDGHGPELLGVDTWFDAAGMGEYYGKHMGGLMDAFAAPPSTSIWTQPAGQWVEW
jgi:hypothetical protein